MKRELIAQQIVLKADCPTCGREQNCKREVGVREKGSDGPVDWTDEHTILRCLGCDTFFYGHFHWFSEDEEMRRDPNTGEIVYFNPRRDTFFPVASKRELPSWFNVSFEYAHPQLSELLSTNLSIFSSGYYTLVAASVRMGFELVSNTLNIDPSLSFLDRIEMLRSKGYISAREKSLLEGTVNAGSAAIHARWKPSEKDAELLIEVLEQFINRALVLPEKLDDLSGRVPGREKTSNPMKRGSKKQKQDSKS